MADRMESLTPDAGMKAERRRLGRGDELLLALLPAVTILAVLGFVEVLTSQRLLFASLASSAFLIYLDPRHGTNTVHTLATAQLGAAGIGLGTYLPLGPGYPAAAAAMVGTTLLMVLADVVHPPAASTALAFAFRAGDASNALLFALAVGVLAALVLLQRAALWLLNRRSQVRPGGR